MHKQLWFCLGKKTKIRGAVVGVLLRHLQATVACIYLSGLKVKRFEIFFKKVIMVCKK